MTNKLRFANCSLLIKRIGQLKEKQVAFMFGSAITMKQSGAGIAGVAEVIYLAENFIEEKYSKLEREEYIEHISDYDGSKKYQETLSYINDVFSNKVVFEFIEYIINENKDERGFQKIPQKIIDFIDLISNKTINCKNILTTNFDSLIEVQLENLNIKRNSISIIADSNININCNEEINVIHLHGIHGRGETMHENNQLEIPRQKLEASIRNILTNNEIYIIGYSGWEDSFTRALANIVNDSEEDYSIIWCFHQNDDEEIQIKYNNIFKTLEPAISRGLVRFFKNVDCNTIFEELKKKTNSFLTNKREEKKNIDDNALIYYNFNDDESKYNYKEIRVLEKRLATELIKKTGKVFIESAVGFGEIGFIRAVFSDYISKPIFFKVNLSECKTKSDIDDKIKAGTGVDIATIIKFVKANEKYGIEDVFIIFSNLDDGMNKEAIAYLLDIINIAPRFGCEMKFIFTSQIYIPSFREHHVKLNELSLQETGIILREYIPGVSNNDINRVHDISDGVIKKLEKIMSYCEIGSMDEVLADTSIFDSIYNDDSVTLATINKIKRLKINPEKENTFNLLLILSVLKNGESLTNIKKSKIGSAITIHNVEEIIELGLAKSINIDYKNKIIKINPIIRDYVLSLISQDEVYIISKSYINITIVQSKDGIKINSINRKIIDSEYNSEGDNGCVILKNIINKEIEDIKESHTRSVKHLVPYLAESYVYSLSNSSRFKETINACSQLITVLEEHKMPTYLYYYYLASSQRMLSEYTEAKQNLDLSRKLAEENDDSYVCNLITSETLLLLESIDKDNAIKLSKKIISEKKRKSVSYMTAQMVLFSSMNKNDKISKLSNLELRARKEGFSTLANNILFRLNEFKSDADRLLNLDKITSTDNSEYNIIKALICKYEILIKKDIDKIKESDINRLRNIYNYLFFQRLDGLFNRCHAILWAIAEKIEDDSIILFIFDTSSLIWALSYDKKNQEKYSGKLNDLKIIN
ncbi:SIR2 family protein [Proteus mirabilis]|uniref:SIR2 family protein n=1 Tax=Proteus mirabilis TaxID=584 RepID=UPI0024BABEF0|nr:SIR2 family protein [Proteus mirabilis]